MHAILLLLSERPMHGYEIIAELEERSEGAWRPSPGSIYPALKRLAANELIHGTQNPEGKRIFSMTPEGSERLAEMDDGETPWKRLGEAGPPLRALIEELRSQARQVGRFGSETQRARAKEILEKAKTDLYSVMAED